MDFRGHLGTSYPFFIDLGKIGLGAGIFFIKLVLTLLCSSHLFVEMLVESLLRDDDSLESESLLELLKIYDSD